MIRVVSRPKPATPAWHQVFLKLAPAIETHAKLSFRHLRPEARAELVQNALCSACAAVARLAELNELDLCYARVLGRYAVAQTRAGRMLGRRLSCKDVASECCQRAKGICLKRLDHYDCEEEVWEEILVEDKTAGPAEIAATKIDFADWLRRLPTRLRRIAKVLAVGERTGDVAHRFGITAARVSTTRQLLKQNWEAFQGERPPRASRVPTAS